MKTLYFISRNFVEFGPLLKEEIVEFKKRNVLTDQDYIRDQNAEEWELLTQWASNGSPVKASKKASSPAKKKDPAHETTRKSG